MTEKRRGLGRGLAALLPSEVPAPGVRRLPVSQLAPNRLQPRTRIERGADGSALIELYSNDPARLEQTTAVLEIVPAGSPEPIKRYLMARRSSPTSGAILIAEGDFATEALPPGRYSASVVALVDNQPVGRVSRAFDVVAR